MMRLSGRPPSTRRLKVNDAELVADCIDAQQQLLLQRVSELKGVLKRLHSFDQG